MRRWGGGLLVLATAVMLALKLTGEIGWSWIVVLAPIWIPAAVSVGTRLALAAVLSAGIYLVFLGGELERVVELLEAVPLVRALPWERILGPG